MRNWRLYWNTIRHLRIQQLIYQAANRLRARPSLRFEAVTPTTHGLAFLPPDKPQSLHERTFTFLNQAVTFPAAVDWNYAANGKLWQYNLNYFDFLNQPQLDSDQGVALIQEFVDRTADLEAGLEPYPISLRIINWIRFLSHHQLELPDVDCHLLAQLRLLEDRLEYHLLGNHLLENGFALLIGSLYFQDRDVYDKAVILVREQLTEQVGQDGGHYERSPMYHQILLDRLLDCCHVLQKDTWHQDPYTDAFLFRYARWMLGWLDSITFTDGSIPLLNDAAEGVAPTTAHLRNKAKRIGIEPDRFILSDSGFRKLKANGFELIANVGSVGPAHQPGHAHADTFSFVLHVHGKPVIVDTGTSTYENNARRQWERSTAAHNTVQVADRDSSEVWGGFRVGRRAQVRLLEDSSQTLRASHDGYRNWGVQHERSWQVSANQLTIADAIGAGQTAVARFYLAPEVMPVSAETNPMTFPWGTISWSNALAVSQKAVQVAQQFNRLVATLVIEVQFREAVQTTITCAG